MKLLFIVLLIVLSVILITGFFYYIFTLPERRENKEILRRETLLCEEKLNAEIANYNAKIAGKIARDNINKIANHKKAN